MQYSLRTVINDSTQTIAIPLRILEIFTTPDENAMETSDSDINLKEIFAYLVRNKYFDHVKQLINAKIPPNMDPSPTPPTPMAKWFLEMIQRPLSIVNRLENVNEFSSLILQEFYISILAPSLSETMLTFIIPALKEFKELPFDKLITCINRFNTQPSINLFYSILCLEPASYCKFV